MSNQTATIDLVNFLNSLSPKRTSEFYSKQKNIDNIISDMINLTPDIMEHNLEHVKELICAGADVNYIVKQNGTEIPVLALAVFTDNIEIVKALIEAGASWDTQILLSGSKRKLLRKFRFNDIKLGDSYPDERYLSRLKKLGWKGSFWS